MFRERMEGVFFVTDGLWSRRYAEVVDFHHADTGATESSRKQRTVKARRKRRRYARLERVCWCQTHRSKQRRLDWVILPVVIRSQ